MSVREPWFSAEELWMLYGVLHAETERREARAFEGRMEETSAIRESEAAAWRSLRAKVRLRIEAANSQARGDE